MLRQENVLPRKGVAQDECDVTLQGRVTPGWCVLWPRVLYSYMFCWWTGMSGCRGVSKFQGSQPSQPPCFISHLIYYCI